MVGTANAYMSRLRVRGGSANVPAYLDDVRINALKPEFLLGAGSVFRFL